MVDGMDQAGGGKNVGMEAGVVVHIEQACGVKVACGEEGNVGGTTHQREAWIVMKMALKCGLTSLMHHILI